MGRRFIVDGGWYRGGLLVMGLRSSKISERWARLRQLCTLPPFENAQVEAQFWHDRDARLYVLRSRMVLAGIFFFWTYIFIEMMIVEETLSIIIVIRCIATAVLLGLWAMFRRRQATPMQREALLGIIGLITVVANLIISSVAGPPLADTLPFVVSMTVAFGVGLISPRFYTTVWSGLTGYALYWISIPFLNASFASVVTNAYFLAFSIFAALFGTFLREKLEREHADTTRRLIALNEKAAEDALAKDRLLASVSHELRTPVNAIVGFSEVMQQGMFGTIEPPRYRRYVDDIRFSAQLLRTGIDDLLEVARLGEQKLAWREAHTSLVRIVEDSVALCDQAAVKAGIRIVMVRDGAGDVIVTTDPFRLTQVLVNVINNAVKFSDPGGHVTIRLARQADRGASVAITDEGCGIAPGDIDRIREPFAQGHTDHHSAHQGGLGLGLSIAGTLMEKMDGRFDIESDLGKGTTVSVILPPHRITEARVTPRPNAAPRAERAETG